MWKSPALSLVGIGSYLAAVIVVPTVIGHYLDSRFGTEPVLTLVLLVVGLIAGFFGAYRQLQDVLRETNRD
jgi:F0F1-type ATP synthase assembly protein I